MIYKLKSHKDGFELIEVLSDDQYARLKYEQLGCVYATQQDFDKLDPNVIIDRKGLLK